MKIKSFVVVVIVVLVLGGGVIAANALNLWAPKPVLVSQAPEMPSVIADNASGVVNAAPDFNTPYKPAEISGTSTFAELSQMFRVPLNDLGTAFVITSEPNWQNLKARELKAIYTNLPANVKLETESVRAFIALYTGKAYTYSDSAYLPKPAVDILKQKAKLTPQQIAYLDSHTYNVGSAAATGTAITSKHTVTGETSFQTLIGWGIPAGEIEKVIGDKLPVADTIIRAYAIQKGKDFLAIVSAMQELANRY
jgi:hypothetical protein